MADKFIPGLIALLLLIVSLSLHEWAHAFVASTLGDPTPKMHGRLSINPLVHVDIIGTILVPLAIILLMPNFIILGWAKPVPINPSYFNKKHRRLCELAVSLAGPFSNAILAIFSAVLGAALAKYFGGNIGSLFGTMAWLNIIMFLFNLIPVPPLDGSYLLKTVLAISDETFLSISRYGFIILLILINLPLFRVLLSVCVVNIFWLISAASCSMFHVPQSVLFPF
jgi:Zn-dependent protease